MSYFNDDSELVKARAERWVKDEQKAKHLMHAFNNGTLDKKIANYRKFSLASIL
jgi:hypothetical protein